MLYTSLRQSKEEAQLICCLKPRKGQGGKGQGGKGSREHFRAVLCFLSSYKCAVFVKMH